VTERIGVFGDRVRAVMHWLHQVQGDAAMTAGEGDVRC
jgi:hypothetical protein